LFLGIPFVLAGDVRGRLPARSFRSSPSAPRPPPALPAAPPRRARWCRQPRQAWRRCGI